MLRGRLRAAFRRPNFRLAHSLDCFSSLNFDVKYSRVIFQTRSPSEVEFVVTITDANCPAPHWVRSGSGMDTRPVKQGDGSSH